MLRNSNQSWWRRLTGPELVPAYIQNARPDVERRCPECRALYNARDRYCPECRTATPEWRYG